MFDESILRGSKRLHFIGIGGSGMFPLVQIFQEKGYRISGSDNNEGDTVEQERKMGIPVYMGHSPDHLKDAEVVIYSAAIMQDNPELTAARERGIPTLERSEVLGHITRQYGHCICVSGTHGKTTVTAMLTQILVEAGLDPTAVIGGKLPLIGGNGRSGKSDLMTCEACEFVDTFLQLSPGTAVILNIDADHLDYFGTLDNIIKSFRTFAKMATKGLIVNGDDANTLQAVAGLNKEITTFGLGELCAHRAANITRPAPVSTEFDWLHGGKHLARLTLNVPGAHNVLNALAACVAALEAGATPEQIAAALPHFRGAGRRFEVLGERQGVTIADDYAHHPAELAVTLKAAKEMGYKQVWAVFQPFTYSRTALLLDDFAEALSIADRVVLSEIMGAREVNTYGVCTEQLAAKIPGCVWFPTFEEIAKYVMDHAQSGDLVLTLGCGDIYKCAKLMRHQQPEGMG